MAHIEELYAVPSPAQEFQSLQSRLAPLFERVFPHPLAPRTVVVVPSLSLDAELLSKIDGVSHYEQRMLCMLLLLRMPHTQVVFLSSMPVDPAIVDYYLHLLPGIPTHHARRRLTLLSCHDASFLPLSRKLLDRPRLLQRVREAIPDPALTHLSCFAVTTLERDLALALDVPIYGCDPALEDLGSKSGSREVFRQAGVPLPDGIERLRDAADLIEAVTELRKRHPDQQRLVVKVEGGTSGEGNAVLPLEGCPVGAGVRAWVAEHLPRRLQYEAEGQSWEPYEAKLREVGGVVECWMDGKVWRSPSVQCRVDPLGGVELISSHDQILGGPTGQKFKGCIFPADDAYRCEIQAMGEKVAHVLRDRGVLGRFGVDFVSLQDEAGAWRHYAIEINLRKGGTTHTYMMLQFLTAGTFHPATGLYLTPSGQPRCYYATDNLQHPAYRGLTPDDLLDIAVDHNLHFHGATQQGVTFHLIGALSEYGKLGMVCVADTVGHARELYEQTVAVLDRETAG